MGEAAGTIAGTMIQADAQKREGEYARLQGQMNARLAEVNAKDAEVRGKREADNVRRQARQMSGSQKAAMAAAGLSVEGDTSAAQIIDETGVMGELDAQTVQNNAFKEAWGFRQEAAQQRFRGNMAKRMGNWGAEMTYLSGGIQLAGQAARAAATKGRG